MAYIKLFTLAHSNSQTHRRVSTVEPKGGIQEGWLLIRVHINTFISKFSTENLYGGLFSVCIFGFT